MRLQRQWLMPEINKSDSAIFLYTSTNRWTYNAMWNLANSLHKEYSLLQFLTVFWDTSLESVMPCHVNGLLCFLLLLLFYSRSSGIRIYPIAALLLNLPCKQAKATEIFTLSKVSLNFSFIETLRIWKGKNMFYEHCHNPNNNTT